MSARSPKPAAAPHRAEPSLPDWRDTRDGEEGLIFVGAKGAMPRRGGFRRIWAKALAEVGLKGIRFHDLRHTGSTLTTIAGTTLPELKERMGHSSDRAAMIYLHATQERHQEIADTLSAMTRAQLKGTQEKPTGTRRARRGRKQS
ncbi:tyrosine-type recombinase/integrase [Actinocorallia sp. B10E7]|uniref:tyrosine-type recombinase/integrase n=1 Tax=Actinocorallia sp. B10E7 TaxID=3153558 RepID=UPI00325E55B7